MTIILAATLLAGLQAAPGVVTPGMIAAPAATSKHP